MKFIISQDGTIIVNSDLLRTVYVEEGYYDTDHKLVHVEATIRNDANDPESHFRDETVTLAKFDTGSKDANFNSAKKYLQLLFAELNGGM
ncbi:MAG: hypothetical protein IJ774_06420 [Selenomonadaceae bacterium]|nr:hypothetical protein [Selenomonadaceae bacterium]